MLIGSFPVADSIEDNDILLISKDGVHLMQITADMAGLGNGGGLRWWKENETEIYREYEVSDLGAPVATKFYTWDGYVQTEVVGYKYKDRYYEKVDFEEHAGYPAIDISNNQPGIHYYDEDTGEDTGVFQNYYYPTPYASVEEDETHVTSANVTQTATVTFGKNNYRFSASMSYSKAFPYVYSGIMDINMYCDYNNGYYGFDPFFMWRYSAIDAGVVPQVGEDTPAEEVLNRISAMAADPNYHPTYPPSRYMTYSNAVIYEPFKYAMKIAVPCFVAATCRGYYPDYEEKTTFYDAPEGYHFPNIDSNVWLFHAPPFTVRKSDGLSITDLNHEPKVSPGDLWKPPYDTAIRNHAEFLANGNPGSVEVYFGALTAAANWKYIGSDANDAHPYDDTYYETLLDKPLLTRPMGINIDYKDPDGFVWDVVVMPLLSENSYAYTKQTDSSSSGTSVANYTEYDLGDTGYFAVGGVTQNKIYKIPSEGINHFAYTNYAEIEPYIEKIETRKEFDDVCFCENAYAEIDDGPFAPERRGSPGYFNAMLNPDVTLCGGWNHYQYFSWYTPKSNINQFYERNARNMARDILQSMGLNGYRPLESDTAVIRTNIGVERDKAFKTGYTYYNEELEPIFKETAHIDPYSGDGYFGGALFENGKRISDVYQKKLKAGNNIVISADNTISAQTDFDPAEFIRDNFTPGTGIDIDATQDEKLQLNLDHSLIGGAASGTLVPCTVTRSTPAGTNQVIDTIQVDKSDLGIPTITVGHGLQDIGSPALHQHILESKALDNIKVNGVKAQRTYDGTQDGDGWYVDLDISGGGGKDTTVYVPVPDYNHRSLITTFTAVNDEYTAPKDGVLYFNTHWISSTTTVNINIGGVVFEIGTARLNAARSDGACMIPMAKGQKAKIVAKTGDISTSESTVGGRFYFIPYLEREETDTDFVSSNINYTATRTSISPYNLPVITSDTYDPEESYYTFEPTADGVIMPSNGTPSVAEGHFKIFPLEEDGTCTDAYYFGYVYNGYAPFEAFPVRKGRTYKIGRSSSSKTGFMQFIPFVTSQDSNIWTPIPDYANAEELTLIDGASGLKTIPSPTITDRPGILIDKCYSSSDLQFVAKVVVSDGNWNLTHSTSNTLHSYIQVPAYVARAWYYTLDSGHTGTPKVIFVPFKKLAIPGVDYIVENGNSLVNNGVCDLTSLFNRVAALEAEVFPTT